MTTNRHGESTTFAGTALHVAKQDAFELRHLLVVINKCLDCNYKNTQLHYMLLEWLSQPRQQQ